MIGKTLSHYRVDARIGAGGMGEVYRAHDTRLDRDVALKILPPDIAHDSQRTARFEQEARAVASLSHPNILAIYDFVSDADQSYAVMELLEGETLGERIMRGPISPRTGNPSYFWDRTRTAVREFSRRIFAPAETPLTHAGASPVLPTTTPRNPWACRPTETLSSSLRCTNGESSSSSTTFR